jgi:hypothetical protein
MLMFMLAPLLVIEDSVQTFWLRITRIGMALPRETIQRQKSKELASCLASSRFVTSNFLTFLPSAAAEDVASVEALVSGSPLVSPLGLASE